jgi:hypothetical protein
MVTARRFCNAINSADEGRPMHGLRTPTTPGRACALGDVEHVGGESQLIGVDVDGEQANGSHRQRRGTGTFVARML